MKQLSVKEIAALVGAKDIIGNADKVISAVASLADAQENNLSFLGNMRYEDQVPASKAGAVIVMEDYREKATGSATYLICDNVDVAFSKAIMIFAPEPIQYAPGIHPSAVVAESAKIGQGVHIGANAVIEEGVQIGDGTVIGTGCYIGHFTNIGMQNLIYANVTIRERCIIGHQCIIHPGVVIGADGFGFAPTPQGAVKLPQVGIVQIDNAVEIGANSTIDRARFGKTWIKSGVKIDNLVMVAHNVEVGEGSILVAQVGIAGSAKIGRGVQLAAKVGINGHITVGDGTQVAATSALAKSCPPNSIMLGTPAVPQKEFMVRFAAPKKVVKLGEKLKELASQVAQLKSKLG